MSFKKKGTGERELLTRTDDQEYGLVSKALGGSKFSVKVSDKTYIGKLRGTLRRSKKSNRVDPGSVVLISIRDFQDSNVDIIHVYSNDEVRKLKKSGELNFDIEIEKPETETEAESLNPFNFEDI
jgi:initiation factor 1A